MNCRFSRLKHTSGANIQQQASRGGDALVPPVPADAEEGDFGAESCVDVGPRQGSGSGSGFFLSENVLGQQFSPRTIQNAATASRTAVHARLHQQPTETRPGTAAVLGHRGGFWIAG